MSPCGILKEQNKKAFAIELDAVVTTLILIEVLIKTHGGEPGTIALFLSLGLEVRLAGTTDC